MKTFRRFVSSSSVYPCTWSSGHGGVIQSVPARPRCVCSSGQGWYRLGLCLVSPGAEFNVARGRVGVLIPICGWLLVTSRRDNLTLHCQDPAPRWQPITLANYLSQHTPVNNVNIFIELDVAIAIVPCVCVMCRCVRR